MLNARLPVARTPLHHWHATHGARFADRDGWQVVAAYTSAEQEAEAARAGLGLADISAFAKSSLRGSGVSSLVPDGAASRPHGVTLLSTGTALACRLAEDHLLLLASTLTAADPGRQLASQCENRPVVQTDVTSTYAGFAVVGPCLEELLRRLTHLDVRPAFFPVNSCAETALAGVEALLVRSEEFPFPSMRIYVAWDLGEYVWERILEAGPGSITPVGMDALRLLGDVPGEPGS